MCVGIIECCPILINVGGCLVRRKVRRKGFKMNQDGLEMYIFMCIMVHGHDS